MVADDPTTSAREGGPESHIRVRADIIGHARINMYVNLSHAWFKMDDYIRTHRMLATTQAYDTRPAGLLNLCSHGGRRHTFGIYYDD